MRAEPAHPIRRVLVPAILLVASTAARASSESADAEVPAAPAPEVAARAAVPGDAVLEANGAVIGEILIRSGNIFDPEQPGEDNRLFRAANRLHRTTRQGVIRRLLLFRSGDLFSRRVLQESERILRSTSYLYDASIEPVRYEDNTVDVEVVTRDVWTLRVGVGFSRSGGENSTRFGVKDSNFLGTGKEVLVRRTSDVDRSSLTYRFRDPNIRGHRVELFLQYSDNTDGNTKQFGLGRPFYALDARWGSELGLEQDDRVEPLYDRGEIFDEFRHRREHYSWYYGGSAGHAGRTTRRWKAGLGYQRDRYAEIPGRTIEPLPPPRELVYPWLGVEWIKDGFIEAHDLDRIQRTEDLNLGQELRGWVGWSTTTLGADRDRALFGVSYAVGASPAEGQIVRGRLHASGRFAGGRGENLRVGGSVQYYLRDFGRHVFFVEAGADAVRRLDRENQLLLGGDTGLRGFPLRFLPGDRRLLLTLEQRFYTDWHVFRLLHVGAAVFFDAGRSWFAGSPDGDDRVYKDVGFGLRIGSSRSASAAMVHVDVAFPLNGDRSIEKTQFLVTTRETF